MPNELELQRYRAILGVGASASTKEIRAAYRRMALSTHPDKNGGCEQERFKQIQEAYRMLNMHKEWETEKDTEREKERRKQRGGAHVPVAPLQTVSQAAMVCLWIWLMMQRQSSDKAIIKPAPLELKCRVTLEDLYLKRIKKIRVKVARKGGGQVVEELYLSLYSYQETYTFEGVGDESEAQGGEGVRGDIVVRLDIEENAAIRIDCLICPYDLWMEMDINLKDYYFGKRICIADYLGSGAAVEMETEPGQRMMVQRGFGLPYNNQEGEDVCGDLYVHLNLVLPPVDDMRGLSEFRELLDNYYASKGIL